MIGGILIAAVALAINVGDCVKDPSGRVYKVLQKDEEIYVLQTIDGTNLTIGVPEEVVLKSGKKTACE